MNRPKTKEEAWALIEALTERVTALETALKESETPRLMERIAKVETQVNELDPRSTRMDRAQQTQYIIQTVKQQLAKQRGTPDAAPTVGVSVEDGAD